MTRVALAAEWLAAVSLALLAVTIAGFIAWSSDRGFNLTDEGFYLLSVSAPEEVGPWPSAWHYIAAPLYRLSGEHIPTFRLLGLGLMLGSGALLAGGVRHLLGAFELAPIRCLRTTIACVAFIELGLLLYYVMFLRTPSYNLLATLCLNAASGLLCIAIASHARNRHRDGRWQTWLSPSIGFSLGALLMIKVSAGVALAVLVVGLVAFTPGTARQQRVRFLVHLLPGCLAFPLVYFLLIQGPSDWWAMVYGGFENLLLIGYQTEKPLLQLSVETTLALLRDGAWIFSLSLVSLILGLLVLHRTARSLSIHGPLRAGLIVAVFLLCTYLAWASGLHRSGERWGSRYMDFYSGWVFVLVVAALGRFLPDGTPTARDDLHVGRIVPLLLVLIAMPFAGSIGTYNLLTINLLFHMAPAFAAMTILLAYISRIYEARWLLHTGMLLIGTFAFLQILDGGLRNPYLGPTAKRVGIMDQQVPTLVGEPPQTLLLDRPRSQTLSEFRALASANGFRPGDDLLVFYSLPGLVYAVGGRSPGQPWYLFRLPVGRKHEQAALARIPAKRLARAYIALLKKRTRSPDLAEFGISFPRDYKRVGSVGIKESSLGRIDLFVPRARLRSGSGEFPE